MATTESGLRQPDVAASRAHAGTSSAASGGSVLHRTRQFRRTTRNSPPLGVMNLDLPAQPPNGLPINLKAADILVYICTRGYLVSFTKVTAKDGLEVTLPRTHAYGSTITASQRRCQVYTHNLVLDGSYFQRWT
jgi:hypothetical protein